jgi:hypothetical protein
MEVQVFLSLIKKIPFFPKEIHSLKGHSALGTIGACSLLLLVSHCVHSLFSIQRRFQKHFCSQGNLSGHHRWTHLQWSRAGNWGGDPKHASSAAVVQAPSITSRALWVHHFCPNAAQQKGWRREQLLPLFCSLVNDKVNNFSLSYAPNMVCCLVIGPKQQGQSITDQNLPNYEAKQTLSD